MSEENKPTPQSEADKEKELAAKRNAFLRYMTIIFAVVFLLVLISLVLQAHTAKAALSDLKESNSSALSNAAVNAELLQDENRKLQEELDSTKKLLADEQEKAKTQEESIAQLEQELEALRTEHAEASESSEGTQEAYDALLTALRCTTREGNVTFSKAMSTVEKYKEYLSQEALAVYEALQEN